MECVVSSSLGHRVGSFWRRLGSRVVGEHLRVSRVVWGETPIPLGYWLRFRSVVGSLFRYPNVLSLHSLRRVLRVLPLIPNLRELLAQDELGTWALDAATINLLWRRLQEDRPKVIVECGAGASTLVLAHYAANWDPNASGFPSLLSIEQDLEIKKGVEARLTSLGFEEYVRVVHASVSEEGRYTLDVQDLWNQSGIQEAGWVLIDGPAGPSGCRRWTLPRLAMFCRAGARWFLHDAFRDGELCFLREWQCLPGITVDGIYPLGKGLATGLVEDPQAMEARIQTK